jgi:hypothetical protein
VGAQVGYNLQAGWGVLGAELEGSYMNNEVPMPDGKVETRFRGVHVTESELMVPDRIDGIGSPGLPGYMDAQHDKLFRQAVNNARSSIAAPLPANAPIWSSNSPYGDFSYGGYSWNNDVWGTGAGPQTISVHAGKQWSVWSNQPNTDGIKSYPHQALNIEKPLSSINTLTSSFKTLKHPISFDAPDDRKVNLLLGVIWPRDSREGFVPALSRSVRLLRQPGYRECLRNATSSAEAHAGIEAFEAGSGGSLRYAPSKGRKA